MLLIALVVILALVVVASYRYPSASIISPSVLYSGGFLASTVCAALFSRDWRFTLRWRAFVILCVGSLLFMLVCMVAERLARTHGRGGARHFREVASGDVEVSWQAVAAFGTIETILTLIVLAKISSFFPGLTLSQAINKYNNVNTFGAEDTSFGFPLNQINSLCYATSYYICYLVGSRYAKGEARTPLFRSSLFAMLASLMLTLCSGGRTGAVGFVFVAIMSGLIEEARLEGGWLPLSRRMVLVGAIGFAALLLSFRFLAIGRESKQTFAQYIGMYLGGEIYNLNAFIEQNPKHAISVWGGMTFARTINYIGAKLRIPELVYELDLPFIFLGKKNMGNVYTTYYAFLYDFGFPGVIVLVALMALISWYLYRRAITDMGRHRDLWCTVYAYSGYQLILSFFSNKFYENVVSINFLRVLFYLVIGNLCLRNARLIIGKARTFLQRRQ